MITPYKEGQVDLTGGNIEIRRSGHRPVRALTFPFGAVGQAAFRSATISERLWQKMHNGEHHMIFAQIVGHATSDYAQSGIGLGAAIAVVCSWQRNRSIMWAILAGLFSWLYVIYFAMTRTANDGRGPDRSLY